MTDFQAFLEELLKDPDIKAEYDRLEQEFTAEQNREKG